MVDWMPGNVGLSTFVDEDKDDHEMLDFALIYIGAHNVYYVKYNMDARTTAQSTPFTVTFPHTSVQWPFGHCTCQLMELSFIEIFVEECRDVIERDLIHTII